MGAAARLIALVGALAVLFGAAPASAQEVGTRVRERRSVPMMVSGIVVSSLGVATTGAAVAVLALAEPACEPAPPPASESDKASCDAYSSAVTAGSMLMLAGLSATIAGLPFLLYGAQRQRSRAAIEAEISVGIGQLGLRVRF
jgi:hypothetical protein